MADAIAAYIFIRSTNFHNFHTCAQAFCTHLESLVGERDAYELMQTLELLLDLYKHGLTLKNVTINSSADPINHENADYIVVVHKIDKSLPFQYYRQVLEPLNDRLAETGLGDVADDLKDIYMDLKKSLRQFASDSSIEKENAAWAFKFDFDHHYGDHCISAIGAIHHYLQKWRIDQN